MAALRSALVKRRRLFGVENRTEVSHEAPDDFGIRCDRPVRCRNHHAATAYAFGRRLAGSAGMMSLRDFQTAISVDKLPVEDFEDQSLVYS